MGMRLGNIMEEPLSPFELSRFGVASLECTEQALSRFDGETDLIWFRQSTPSRIAKRLLTLGPPNDKWRRVKEGENRKGRFIFGVSRLGLWEPGDRDAFLRSLTFRGSVAVIGWGHGSTDESLIDDLFCVMEMRILKTRLPLLESFQEQLIRIVRAVAAQGGFVGLWLEGVGAEPLIALIGDEASIRHFELLNRDVRVSEPPKSEVGFRISILA